LREQNGDFVKLEETKGAFGPGPALILYKVPAGVVDDEIQDMLSDTAPVAFKLGVTLSRIDTEVDKILCCKVGAALDQIVNDNAAEEEEEECAVTEENGYPVLYFSGFDNSEMMAAYNLVGSQIFEESGMTAACAKAVPNAMRKQLGRIIEEISGDHALAMGTKLEEEE